MRILPISFTTAAGSVNVYGAHCVSGTGCWPYSVLTAPLGGRDSPISQREELHGWEATKGRVNGPTLPRVGREGLRRLSGTVSLSCTSYACGSGWEAAS